MKGTIVIKILIFSLSVSASYAQQQTPKSLLEIIKDKPAAKRQSNNCIYGNILAAWPKAILLTVTQKGKVYALPQDNMPCLIPNNNSVPIPVMLQPVLPNGIPNAAFVYPVIPNK